MVAQGLAVRFVEAPRALHRVIAAQVSYSLRWLSMQLVALCVKIAGVVAALRKRVLVAAHGSLKVLVASQLVA